MDRRKVFLIPVREKKGDYQQSDTVNEQGVPNSCFPIEIHSGIELRLRVCLQELWYMVKSEIFLFDYERKEVLYKHILSTTLNALTALFL